ncbi:MAG TPA: hypothetical protein VEO54_22210 [Thermoanaerobaculia bacterium]|nr:hypothetical protein [Thermoanaerobaculia bacterium]
MTRIDEVLAGLQEERQRLRAELAEVEQAIASLEGAEESQPYARLNVYEAAAHYLARAGEPKTAREIADALRAGGFNTRSTRFANTITTMLRRGAPRGLGIRRTRDGRRWYMGIRRAPTSGTTEPTSGT